MCEYCKVGTNVYRIKRNFLEKKQSLIDSSRNINVLNVIIFSLLKLVLEQSLNNTSNAKIKATFVAFIFFL